MPKSVLFESNDCVEVDGEGRRQLVIGIMNLARFLFYKYRISPPALIQAEEDLDATAAAVTETPSE